MSQPTRHLAFDGDAITMYLPTVTVRLTCVWLDRSYRVTACYGRSIIEVEPLCKSYPTEDEARSNAREMCRLFLNGARPDDVVDVLRAADAALLAVTS